jgi:hypothetical protein
VKFIVVIKKKTNNKKDNLNKYTNLPLLLQYSKKGIRVIKRDTSNKEDNPKEELLEHFRILLGLKGED